MVFFIQVWVCHVGKIFPFWEGESRVELLNKQHEDFLLHRLDLRHIFCPTVSVISFQRLLILSYGVITGDAMLNQHVLFWFHSVSCRAWCSDNPQTNSDSDAWDGEIEIRGIFPFQYCRLLALLAYCHGLFCVCSQTVLRFNFNNFALHDSLVLCIMSLH